MYFGNCSPVEFDESMRRAIADAVRARRTVLGISQEEVAARSAGMISTANVRVFEGVGRPTFRARSLVGLARALDWPDDAVERIANGADPTGLEPRSAGAPTGPNASSAVAPRERVAATIGGIELATSAEVDELRQELVAQRRLVEQLARRVERLGGDADADTADAAGQADDVDATRRRAAHSGQPHDADPEGPPSSSLPRTTSFDPDA
jgi:hypothetical protein